MIRRLLTRHRRGDAPLIRDSRGAVLIEFAFVVPIFLLLVMGFCELAYQAYVQSVLTGAVAKAGRDATIQGATTSSLDSSVLLQIQAAAPKAAFATGFPKRKSYAQFGDIQAEPFVDTNGNGIRDNGECFTDVNDNDVWDADPGTTGQGGANDAVVYTVSIVYPRLFPLAARMGWGPVQTLSATTTLKNQPYASQQTGTYSTVCT
jgi:Flp pilus assembly protein TadG